MAGGLGAGDRGDGGAPPGEAVEGGVGLSLSGESASRWRWKRRILSLVVCRGPLGPRFLWIRSLVQGSERFLHSLQGWLASQRTRRRAHPSHVFEDLVLLSEAFCPAWMLISSSAMSRFLSSHPISRLVLWIPDAIDMRRIITFLSRPVRNKLVEGLMRVEEFIVPRSFWASQEGSDPPCSLVCGVNCEYDAEWCCTPPPTPSLGVLGSGLRSCGGIGEKPARRGRGGGRGSKSVNGWAEE